MASDCIPTHDQGPQPNQRRTRRWRQLRCAPCLTSIVRQEKMISSSPISRVSLVQTLIILIGVVMTAASLKWFSYPEQTLDWNPIAVAVRDFGFLLLLVPAAWAIVCAILERRSPDWWSPVIAWLSGIALIAGLGGLFYWTISTPYFYHKVPFQTMGQ
jgi:hypothetical protein